MPDRFLPTAVVLDRICISKTQLYRKINAGEFPKPVPIGKQRVAFLEAEVQAWMDARIEARDQGEGSAARRTRAIRAVGGRS